MPTDSAPWAVDATAVASGVGVDPTRGLSAAEQQRRLECDGPNALATKPPRPVWRKILAQFADPLVYLLLAATAISLVAWGIEGADGIPYDTLVIAVIVVANAILGYVQEARAERAVAALQEMTAATTTVLRDGQESRVASVDVVVGDVMLLEEGDAISADGRLVEAVGLSVAEASLTGESAPVAKTVDPVTPDTLLADRSCMVHNGTTVTRGRGRAVVTATGMDTEMGRVAQLLDATQSERTPLQREVARIGRALGIAVIVIAIVVIAAVLLVTDVHTVGQLVDVLLIGVSLAVAAVPEGLPTIMTVILALGVQRMARSSALVKRLSSVETLGSASVICSDKTGTLTRNEMTVRAVATAGGTVEITGSGYQPEGEIRQDGEPLADPVLLDEVQLVIGGGSLANNAVLGPDPTEALGDPTEIAFLVAEEKGGAADTRRETYERIAEVPFSSERKLMSAVAVDGDDTRIVVTKGAPDVLLSRCVAQREAGEVRPLTDERRQEILDEVDEMADQALRTLGVAYRPLDEHQYIGQDVDESVEHDLIHLGIVGMIDPPRVEAAGSIAEAHRAGIRILMITGDHPRTAGRIAADLGIVEPGSPVLTGADLAKLDDEALRIAVRDVSVYARVAPEQKLQIIRALQDLDEIVAMTGDGVNDAPALKAAEIGVAMGITGTEVAKEAADMILADDDFTTIVRAVREGRAIFAGIRKTIRFLLSSNIGEVLTMLLGVALAGWLGLTGDHVGAAVPLLATQILWVNLLTDTAPALAMGIDPPPDDIMDQRPRRLSDRVIDARMWFGIIWVGAVMAVVSLIALDLGMTGGLLPGDGDITTGRTMAFTTLVFAQLFNCFNARSDVASAFKHLFTNAWLWAAIALSVVLQVAVVQIGVLNKAFSTTPLSIGQWAITIGLAAVVLVADELKKAVVRYRLHSARP